MLKGLLCKSFLLSIINSTSEYHIDHAKTILKNINYATVVTASVEAKPWNSPVAYFYDEDLTIYWFHIKKRSFTKCSRER